MQFHNAQISPLCVATGVGSFCLIVLCVTLLGFRSNSLASSLQQPSIRPQLVLQRGHTLGINCAAFAPDGSWVASGAADNTILIWQTTSGRQLRALTGHKGYVRSLAISSDGQLLASGSNDHTIKVWNVAEGRDLFTLSGHEGEVEALAFSRGGRWLVSGSADKTIKVWDLTSRKEIQTLNRRSAPVSVLAFSGNDELLAAAEGNVIRLWDTKKWREAQTLRRHNTKVSALVFSDDNAWFASASTDGSVLIWHNAWDREQFALKNNTSGVAALAFARDGSLIVAHADGGIDSWNYTDGKKKSFIGGEQDTARVTFACFSSNAENLASTDGGRDLHLRDAANGKVERVLQTQSTAINAVAFSRDGRWFASAAGDSAIRLWQVATGTELPRLIGHAGYATTIAFSPDSRLLASGGTSGEIKIWDVSSNQLAFNLPSQAQSINRVAFSPDSKFLAAAGMDQRVQIWDLDTKQSRVLTGHTDEITSLVFLAGGKLVSGGRDTTIRLWDVKTGETIASLDNIGAEVNALAVSADSSILAAANADNTIRLWQLPNPAPIKTLTGHTAEVWTVAFSPDNKLLASGSSDHNVMLWDLKSDSKPRQLAGSSETVTGVTFDPEGKWLMAGSDEGSILLWNTSTGALRGTIVSMPGTDDWLVTTPDGLFDGSPESWSLMLWRFGGLTFNVVPVEAYFNEFYYPGVLADIFADKDPKATQDIVQKDRRQPQINLNVHLQGNTATTRNVDIEIEVHGAPPDKDHQTESGARDLRLFRNGLLIRRWSGDLLQNEGARTLRTTIQVVAGENRISAYAFNRDNIKSSDATVVVNGANGLSRKGAINLLVLGVERYANSNYDLKYPVADADEMSAQLRTQQEQLGRYSPIVTIPLTNAEATKRNILLALGRLAGNSAPLPADAPKVLASIAPAQPEDAVVLYFSGHGTALKDRFYLIPHDMGYTGRRDALDGAGLLTILSHSISDEELVDALQPMDVDQLLVIIDACNSGAALESNEKRRGPMNTKGLAQLAYEKGIYVLTASQSVEVAFEADALKHSYLAYALLEEGIKKRAADENHDGSIFLKEWFDYANERVPEIRRTRNQQRKELIEDEPDEQKVQRPRVFYTRETGARQFLVAH
ncbi:MAG TPA: caspase family protein [Pyrinomonadaceae bacterium]